MGIERKRKVLIPMAWSKQGEHNVPKRYLKNTEWTKNGPLGTGYYIGDPDDKSKNQNIIPVDFNFKALQWGLTHKKDDHFVLERPAPIQYGLRIFDEERTPDRSHWGPIDGTPNEEESLSDTGGDTPDPDITIPLDTQSQDKEFKLVTLTQLIPSYISKPSPLPHLLAGAMAQIAATTTLTTNSLVAQTLGAGVSKEELPQVPKESSRPYSPHNTIEEMEVEMILLNLTDEILENAWTTGKEVVEMEMGQGVVVGVVEADLIMRVMSIQPTQGHYQIR